MQLRFNLNGENVSISILGNETLLEVLRERFDLKGTKWGCGTGECGACTVLVNGQPINSCIFLGAKAEDKKVTTIEGLSQGDTLHPLQEAFIETGALQCGYCGPGMLLTSKALLDEKKAPTRNEIKDALSGNICRCTGYQKIIEAIELVINKGEGENGM